MRDLSRFLVAALALLIAASCAATLAQSQPTAPATATPPATPSLIAALSAFAQRTGGELLEGRASAPVPPERFWGNFSIGLLLGLLVGVLFGGLLTYRLMRLAQERRPSGHHSQLKAALAHVGAWRGVRSPPEPQQDSRPTRPAAETRPPHRPALLTDQNPGAQHNAAGAERVRVWGYTLPKNGNTQTENEDAWARDEGNLRFAIADGASDGFSSGKWAQALVQAFLHNPPELQSLQTWLNGPLAEWKQKVGYESMDRASWYEAAKASEYGGNATLLGLQLVDSAGGAGLSWRALAVGDTCLFQVRDGRIITSFPLARSNDFNTTPHLISTDIARSAAELRRNHLKTAQGTCQQGDRFLLATDALAQFILLHQEKGVSINQLLDRGLNEATLEQFISEQRRSSRLKNDDVTIVTIQIL